MLAGATAAGAISLVKIVPSKMSAVLTALFAIFAVVTELLANSAVSIPPASTSIVYGLASVPSPFRTRVPSVASKISFPIIASTSTAAAGKVMVPPFVKLISFVAGLILICCK